jgi:hypothetical protein
MVWDLREAFTDFGLDFDRNVLGRLGARGTVKLHFGPTNEGASAFASVAPVYSLRAKNKKSAQDLFEDLRRVVVSTELGRIIDGRRSKPDLLELRGRKHAFSAFVVVHDDSLLLAHDQAALLQAHDDLRRNSKPRGRRDQVVGSAIETIGGEDVVGLFDLDLEPLFERIKAALPGVDLSGLPRQHIGYLDVAAVAADGGSDQQQRDQDGGAAAEPVGTVVRICVLSSR